MISNMREKLETVANISVISIAVLIGVVTIQNYFIRATAKPFSSKIAEGTKVELPNVNWEENEKTLVLYLRKGCKYCTESMPLYKKIARQYSNKKIQFLVVSRESEDVTKSYLNEHKVDFTEVRQASLESIGALGTPTLILVNQKGEVANSWLGKLNPERERDLLSKL